MKRDIIVHANLRTTVKFDPQINNKFLPEMASNIRVSQEATER